MKRTYINKTLAVFIAVALIVSFVVVLSPTKPTIKAWPGTTPGYNDFGNATKDLVYDQTVTPRINTWGMQNTTYFLYKPAYNCTATGYRYADKLEWFEQVLRTDTYTPAQLVVPGWGNYSLSGPIHLDRAGLWVFSTGVEGPGIIDGNNANSIDAFFWVNTSQEYVIESISDFDYGSNTSKTITVTEDGSTPTNPCFIDLIAPDGSTVFHKYEADGIHSFGTYGNITMAGNYTVRSYTDLDLYSSVAYLYNYMGGTDGYDNTFGTQFSPITKGDNYNYTICGPWDPPEVNATEIVFRVKPGTPVISIPERNQTMYWNFSGEVNISIEDTSEDPIPQGDYTVEIFNPNDIDVTSYFTYTSGDQTETADVKKYDGYVRINSTGWGVNQSDWEFYGGNGTWYANIYVDLNADRTENNKEWTEEWNVTVEWRVRKAPGAQFKWIDDDSTLSSDNNDGVLPKIPADTVVPVDIKFQIIGDDHSYYGAGGVAAQQMAMENISISGNALFTGTLDKVPNVQYSGGTWTVPIIPTMSQGGGSVDIVVTWEDYGSLSETLSIGGTNYLTNGTIVSVTPNEFQIGTDQTFTVEVKYADGTSISSAAVYLYYIDDGEIATDGDPIETHIISSDIYGFDGYTLGLNTTQQRDNQTEAGFTNILAPRNLTVYVEAWVGGTPIYGYARIKMKPSNDLKVTFEAVDSPGTSTLLAGYKYSYFYINITTIDVAGNASGIPEEDDYSQIIVQIIDEDGDVVTLPLGSISTSDLLASTMGNDYVYALTNEYIDVPGTYTVYVKNNTYDSTDNNATIYVKQAHVECDKVPLIWSYDDNISATFTVTSEITGELLNGELRIENMTWTDGTYNMTWTNTSDSPNSTIELDEGDGFIDGQVTVNDITANYLPPGEAERNITFWFQPELSDGGKGFWARASGMVKVQVPTVRFDAAEGETGAKEIKYVRVGQSTDVVAYVTGRGELLPDIYVGLNGQGISTNSTTGVVDIDKGKVTLSIIPQTTGNITVDVGEDGRTVDMPVIIVTSWALDITVDARISENTAFTVTVMKEGTTTPVEDAAVEIQGIGTINTDADGKALFDGTYVAPEVTSDTTYTVTATADGYLPDSMNIVVVNVPKLSIILPDSAVYGKDTFTIYIADDTGSGILGATVTFDGKTYTSKANGAVTITAPDISKDKTYTVTVTFGAYDEQTVTFTIKATKGAPGFELLTLVIALGIAFIILRRRRR